MEKLVDILMNYYLYFAGVLAFLLLAVIGYMIDSIREKKIKREYEKKNEEVSLDIPIASLDGNIKLSESVNKLQNKGNEDVKPANVEVPSEEPPVAIAAPKN